MTAVPPSRPFRRGIPLLLALLLPLPAAAHHLCFQHAAGGWRLARGHPESGSYRPCRDVTAVRLWIVLPDSLRPVPAGTGTEIPDSLLSSQAVGLLADVDWGTWTKTPGGTRHAPPDSVAEALESWRSRETVLQLLAPAAAPPLLGRNLELRPLTPPDRWRRGRKLRVRVTRDGRPAAGVTVVYGERPRGVTPEGGELNVRLRRPGWQVVSGSLRLPPPPGGRVATVLSGTLIFPLEDRP